ncbi:MAG: DUF4364 family protein [Bacillota bacterium]|nr:DUF4364 family protein [Bacillota bacterium]
MRIQPEEMLRAKLTILYILDYFSVPLTKEQFEGFMMEEEFINFFDLQRYMEELIGSEMISFTESEEGAYYVITELGRSTVELMHTDIAKPLRRRINDAIDNKKKSFTSKTDIFTDYSKLDEYDYRVKLGINEGSMPLMSLEIAVLTNKDAKILIENWKKNARFLYGDLLHILSDTQKVYIEEDDE